MLEQCQFGAFLNEMSYNQLMCGVKDRRLQRRLLAEPDLTFKKAFELCQASELAEKNARVTGMQMQSLKMAGASVMALCSEVGNRSQHLVQTATVATAHNIWPGIAVSRQ